jgi:ABC-type Fe2+-enterobactin transport system substrate-binding protein
MPATAIPDTTTPEQCAALVPTVEEATSAEVFDAAFACLDDLDPAAYTSDSWDEFLDSKQLYRTMVGMGMYSAVADNLPKVLFYPHLVALGDPTVALALIESLPPTTAADDYTPASWAPYGTALTNLEGYLSSQSQPSQVEIDMLVGRVLWASLGLELKDPPPQADPRAVLEDLIALVAGLPDTNYSAAGWQAIQTALGAAGTVAADLGASATQLEDAATALVAAVLDAELAPPPPPEADPLAVLQSLINTVGALPPANYSTAGWQTIQGALTAASGVANNAAATVAQLEGATTTLVTAVLGAELAPVPPPEADPRAVLQSLIATVGALPQANYSTAGWQTIQGALTTANGVANNNSASVAQLEAATRTLISTVLGAQLAPPEADPRAVLRDVIARVDGLLEATYSPAGWQTIQNALTAANGVANNNSASVAQLENATRNLVNAVLGAELAPPDPAQPREELESLIDVVEGLDPEVFTPEDWAAIQAALEVARAAAANSTLTATQLRLALAQLIAAIATAERVTVEVPGPVTTQRVQVPGPTVTQRIEVPGPVTTQQVEVPGPTVTQQVEVPGPAGW